MDEQMRKLQDSDDNILRVLALCWESAQYEPQNAGQRRVLIESAIKDRLAALSQPSAQGDSSHPAGGECGGVQGLTPGPYSVRKSLAGTGIWHITSPAKQDIGAVRSLADAHLFAASGDLLEALEWLVDILPDPELDNDELQRVWTKKARAAISKATP